MTPETICPFHFVIFLFEDEKWYLSNWRKEGHPNPQFHYHHVRTAHHFTSKRDLNQDVLGFITSLVQQQLSSRHIRMIILNRYHLHITDGTIRSIRDESISSLLHDKHLNPSMLGPAQRLIALFENNQQVSYIYVTHSPSQGFRSYYRGTNPLPAGSYSDVGVSDKDVKEWREDLKVSDEEVLIAFFFSHDEEFR